MFQFSLQQNMSINLKYLEVFLIPLCWEFQTLGVSSQFRIKSTFETWKTFKKQDSYSSNFGKVAPFSFSFNLLIWKVVITSQIHLCKALSAWAQKNHILLCLMLTLWDLQHHPNHTAFNCAPLSPSHLFTNIKGAVYRIFLLWELPMTYFRPFCFPSPFLVVLV